MKSRRQPRPNRRAPKPVDERTRKAAVKAFHAKKRPVRAAPAPAPEPVKAAPKRTHRPTPALKPVPLPTEAPEGPSRAGYALLLGRPNVGKSTLLNALVGEHLAIVSPRPQTTRNRILGIVTAPGTQICLVDTPGVHRAKGTLNQAMVRTALSALSEVDLVLFLAEAGWPAGEADPATIDPVGPFHRELLGDVQRSKKPVILVLTKIDLIPKPLLLPLMEAWAKAFPFKDIYPLSAVTGENVEKFVDVVRAALPEGAPLFPPDTVTDQAERALCAEFIREQIFLQLRDEIPYGAAVTIEDFDESERPQNGEGRPGAGLVRIAASVMVSRDSHKGIVIGHHGERLKEIGTAARKSIEALLGCKVWLEIHVRVVQDWTEKPALLSELGFPLK